MILKLILVCLLLCAAFTSILCIANADGSRAIEAWGWVALVVISVCIGLTIEL